MNAISAQRASLIRPWRAAAVALAIVASLWSGFAVGRISAPAATNGAAIVQHERGFADKPIVIPTGEPGRVWGHWDSAPVRGARVGSDAVPHAHAHHRVKWG
jgi:hypothetical protein